MRDCGKAVKNLPQIPGISFPCDIVARTRSPGSFSSPSQNQKVTSRATANRKIFGLTGRSRTLQSEARPRGLHGTLQLRPPTEGARRSQAIRIHLQNLDIRARPIRPEPDPPDAGTQYLTTLMGAHPQRCFIIRHPGTSISPGGRPFAYGPLHPVAFSLTGTASSDPRCHRTLRRQWGRR